MGQSAEGAFAVVLGVSHGIKSEARKEVTKELRHGMRDGSVWNMTMKK